MNGVSGVEIDVKVASDGTLLAFHDMTTNALTVKDNAGGKQNPVSVALGHQKPGAPINVADHTAPYLVGTPQKIFGKGAHIINAEDKPKLESLENVLNGLKQSKAPGNFLIVLDIQTPGAADRSAALIRKLGMQKQVYMKIWASSAVAFSGDYRGANTCYEHARKAGWGGINIIPEINELQLKGTKIHVFNADLTVGAYLDCWANAQKDHSGNGAAFMPMVSAMYPNGRNPDAVLAANDAFTWAEKNGRKKMSVIVMPDYCTVSTGRGGGRKAWRGNGKGSAFIQPRSQVDVRRAFCDRRADYCVADVLGDFENFSVQRDYDAFMNGICAV